MSSTDSNKELFIDEVGQTSAKVQNAITTLVDSMVEDGLEAMTINSLPGYGTIAELYDFVDFSGGKVIEFRMPQCEQLDFQGHELQGLNYWGSLPTEDDTKDYPFVILLLSDFDSATPGIQMTGNMLADDRRCGNYVLPKNVAVIRANTITQ